MKQILKRKTEQLTEIVARQFPPATPIEETLRGRAFKHYMGYESLYTRVEWGL